MVKAAVAESMVIWKAFGIFAIRAEGVAAYERLLLKDAPSPTETARDLALHPPQADQPNQFWQDLNAEPNPSSFPLCQVFCLPSNETSHMHSWGVWRILEQHLPFHHDCLCPLSDPI